jgi:hypothetical protein
MGNSNSELEKHKKDPLKWTTYVGNNKSGSKGTTVQVTKLNNNMSPEYFLAWYITHAKENLSFRMCRITLVLLLLGIFRRVPRPSDTRGHPCALLLPRGCPAPLLVIYDTSSIREPPKVSLNVLKLMGKHFIVPKTSEILSIFQVFPCTTQTAPCPFP